MYACAALLGEIKIFIMHRTTDLGGAIAGGLEKRTGSGKKRPPFNLIFSEFKGSVA